MGMYTIHSNNDLVTATDVYTYDKHHKFEYEVLYVVNVKYPSLNLNELSLTGTIITIKMYLGLEM